MHTQTVAWTEARKTYSFQWPLHSWRRLKNNKVHWIVKKLKRYVHRVGLKQLTNKTVKCWHSWQNHNLPRHPMLKHVLSLNCTRDHRQHDHLSLHYFRLQFQHIQYIHSAVTSTLPVNCLLEHSRTRKYLALLANLCQVTIFCRNSYFM